MKTRATKNEAAKLIKTAKRDGWKISADIMTDTKGKPWCVQVSMSKEVFFRSGYLDQASHIIVSLRKGRKYWVVSILVPTASKTFRGLWSANYALNSMRECVARQAQREAVAL